jgi:glyoxylase-like metal-dependent hydrolase (beta-lactamase superfamily II)
MKIGDNVEALEIPMDFLGASGGTINPVVLWSDADGATLIDTGLPGQLGVFEEKLAAVGLSASSLRRILLTHQDLDHIGAASALAGASRAEVYAHAADVPFIQGELPLWRRCRRIGGSRR